MTEYKPSILEEKLEDAEAELDDARAEIQRLTALTAVHYLSTACWHAINDNNPELHTACRNSCKYAHEGHPEYCVCSCHGDAGTQPGRTAWVDQARDIARQLCDVLGGWRALKGLPGDIGDRAANDPALFWLRGEEAPPGEWRPPVST